MLEALDFPNIEKVNRIGVLTDGPELKFSRKNKTIEDQIPETVCVQFSI